MFLFTHLPFEIQHRVLFFLYSHRDVAALSVQCRSLHVLCNMPLRKRYRRIRITSSRKSFNRAFNMLLDILTKPGLGEHVRHIEYTKECCANEPNPEQPRRELSGEEMQLLRAATRRAGFVDAEGLRVIDLLLQLVNLDVHKYATRGLAPEEVGFPLYQLLYRNNTSPQESLFLQHLRSVYMININKDYLDDGRCYSFMDFTGALAMFHRLPSINSVSVDLLLEMPYATPVAEIAESNVSRIAIHHSSITSMYLASLICSCKALREFEYSIGGRSRTPPAVSFFNVKTFIKAILMHKETLEILDVDVEEDMGYLFKVDSSTRDRCLDVQYGQREAEVGRSGPPPVAMWDQSGSLRDFHALKRLSLGVHFLMYFARGVKPTHDGSFSLVDCLPESLESLCIRGYERGKSEENDSQVDALVALQKRATSKLKTIIGIEALIPNSKHVDYPDNGRHLLWIMQEREWSDED
ncbi:hypothetical protein UA08_06034 [Talaromyces atroroseus]|uniref:Leucine-rich repeat domain-containing protein n=1 Tax=Talaromyces atroroseus TaxID=1441469 RepID=A0A225AC78_TALAT|nr:hypothetical protein UA08_06034 [Talaromyces atroroseus]OKL58672.1 hypothetical protein UA08_06034 [Talaromyces atroroseus]